MVNAYSSFPKPAQPVNAQFFAQHTFRLLLQPTRWRCNAQRPYTSGEQIACKWLHFANSGTTQTLHRWHLSRSPRSRSSRPRSRPRPRPRPIPIPIPILIRSHLWRCHCWLLNVKMSTAAQTSDREASWCQLRIVRERALLRVGSPSQSLTHSIHPYMYATLFATQTPSIFFFFFQPPSWAFLWCRIASTFP